MKTPWPRGAPRAILMAIMGSRHRGPSWSAGAAAGWAAFESFSAPTHVLTGAGVIVEANAAFERAFGAPRARFRGRHQAELCDGPAAARRHVARRILREASRSGSWRGVLSNRADDGRRFTTRAQVFPTLVDGRRYFVWIGEEPGALAPAGSSEARHPPPPSLAAPT